MVMQVLSLGALRERAGRHTEPFMAHEISDATAIEEFRVRKALLPFHGAGAVLEGRVRGEMWFTRAGFLQARDAGW
jgi:hypothetical protein